MKLPFKVICVEEYTPYVLKGKEYTVIKEDHSFYYLEELGAWSNWKKSRFVLSDQYAITIYYLISTNTSDAATAMEAALIRRFGNHFLIKKEGGAFQVLMKEVIGGKEFVPEDKAKAFAEGYLAALP